MHRYNFRETHLYLCPNCGHEFEQGEYGYDYDFNVLEFDCPDCGWWGTDSKVKTHDEDDE